MNPFFHTNFSISDSLKTVRKSVLIYETIISGDAAEYLYRLPVMGKDGEIYVLGNGNARPLAEHIRIMQKVTDYQKEPGIGKLPYAVNQVMRLEANIDKALKDTGYAPTVNFADGIMNTLNFFE